MTSSTASLTDLLASGERVNLSELIGARRSAERIARETRLAERRAAKAARRAERARIAQREEELSWGVFRRRDDGSVYLLGGLSDIDRHYQTGEEIVEVEYETGYRNWLPREEILFASDLSDADRSAYLAA